MNECKINNCAKSVVNKTNQLCSAHYAKWLKYGDPTHDGRAALANTRVCEVADCELVTAAKTKAYCPRHQRNLERCGDPATDWNGRHLTLAEKVRLNSEPDPDSDCILWTGNVSAPRRGVRGNRYGRVSEPGTRTTIYAHHAAYMVAYGKDKLRNAQAAGLEVDHRCCTTLCVNPDHLRLATRRFNMHNRKFPNENTRSGFRGVRYHAENNRWVAGHTVNHEWHGAGSYTDLVEAANAARKLRLKLMDAVDYDHEELTLADRYVSEHNEDIMWPVDQVQRVMAQREELNARLVELMAA